MRHIHPFLMRHSFVFLRMNVTPPSLFCCQEPRGPDVSPKTSGPSRALKLESAMNGHAPLRSGEHPAARHSSVVGHRRRRHGRCVARRPASSYSFTVFFLFLFCRWLFMCKKIWPRNRGTHETPPKWARFAFSAALEQQQQEKTTKQFWIPSLSPPPLPPPPVSLWDDGSWRCLSALHHWSSGFTAMPSRGLHFLQSAEELLCADDYFLQECKRGTSSSLWCLCLFYWSCPFKTS